MGYDDGASCRMNGAACDGLQPSAGSCDGAGADGRHFAWDFDDDDEPCAYLCCWG